MAAHFVSLADSEFTNLPTDNYTHLTRPNTSNTPEQQIPTASCFGAEHQLMFRAVHDESQGSNIYGQDITAGSLGQQLFKTVDELYLSIYSHITAYMALSPWISMTPDLLRAITKAIRDKKNGKTGVRIFVIDITKVANVIDTQKAVKYLKRNPDSKCKTEFLVWERIPAEAVVCCWYLEKLEKSGLYNLFPFLKPGPRGRSTVGRARRIMKETPVRRLKALANLPKITRLVIHRLGMDPDLFAATQVVMIMLGWSRQKCTMNELQDFENNIPPTLKVDDTIYKSRKRGPPLTIDEWKMKREPKSATALTRDRRSVQEIVKSLIENDQSPPVDSQPQRPYWGWFPRL